MKHIEERLKQVKSEVVTRLQRDICNRVAQDHLHRHTNRWSTLDLSTNETTVMMRTGSDWPGGGSGEKVEIDICPDCFVGKLIPWVKEQGGTPTVTERDY